VASINQDILPRTTLAVDGVLSERTSRADNAGFGTQDDSVYLNRLIDINGALHTDLGHSWSLDNSLGYSAVHIKQDDLNFSGGVETEYVSRVNSQQYTADSTISGPILTLPGGPLKVAVGFHFQRELFTTSLNGSTTKNANRDVYAGYGELLLPIIGHENSLPLVDRLQLDVSGRVDHYSDFGYTENPKIGVLWGPTRTIDFRASYSTSFKPPVLGYVGANDQSAGVFTNDLINAVFGFSDAVPSSAPFILNGGTAKNLKPETASSFTVGSDYDDTLSIGHAHLSVTYYHIDFRNQIGAPQYPNGEFNILNLYLNNPNSVPPGVVVPNPTAAQVNALIASANAANGFHDSFGLYQGPNNVGYIVNFLTGNLARTLTDGLSFDGALTREQFGGNLSFTLNATYVLHYDQQNSPVSPLVNLVNTVYNPIGFKARLGADWQDSNWSIASFVNYTDSYKDTNVTPSVPVGSWTTVDLQVGYHPDVKSGLLSGTRLVLSVSNLFDAKPPFVASNAEFYILGYDPTNASAIGRLVSIQLAKKW
jgi:outer membrane receptor protein involved in Fe transport